MSPECMTAVCVTQKYLAGHDGSEGVLCVGIAQERATVWTSTRRRNPLTGATYDWLKKTSKLVNHIYWYCFDDDFGPFLLRVCTLHLLPVQCPADRQRQPLGTATGEQGGQRVHPARQRVRRLRRRRRVAGDLRELRRRTHRGAADQMAAAAAAAVHRGRREPRRLLLPARPRSGGVLLDPHARQAGVGADIPRAREQPSTSAIPRWLTPSARWRLGVVRNQSSMINRICL